MVKVCRKCGAEKPIADFYTHKQMADGRLNTCKPCFIIQTNVAERRRRRLSPTYVTARNSQQRAWRAGNPERVADSKTRYMTRHRDRALAMKRARRIEKAYRITPAEYAQRLAACGGRCEICGGAPGGRWGKLFIDHNHKTEKVRGMLCINCNLAIGYLADDPQRVRSVADYLDRHGGKVL